MIETKQQALDLFEETRQNFLKKCRSVARDIARTKESITIDDVRLQVQLPEGLDGRVFGAVFHSDEWEKVGYINSKQKENHGRPIGVFKIKNPKPPEMSEKVREITSLLESKVEKSNTLF